MTERIDRVLGRNLGNWADILMELLDELHIEIYAARTTGEPMNLSAPVMRTLIRSSC